MDVHLLFPGIMTQNPDEDWLTGYDGPHIDAFANFVEACWMYAAYASQRPKRVPQIQWHEVGVPKPEFFDALIDRRKEALLTGFFVLTPDQINALAALPVVNANQERIRDRYVALYTRHSATADLYGQQLPLALGELLALIEDTEPFSQQGESALTKRFAIGAMAYFAKITDLTMTGLPPLGQDEFNEMCAAHGVNALHPGLAPEEVYVVMTADGSSCAVLREVAGKSYAPRQRRWAVRAIPVEEVQRVMLAEWLFGMDDRSYKNLLIDKEARTVHMIDFARSWEFHSQFLNETVPVLKPTRCFARVLLDESDPNETFARSVVQSICERQNVVLAALEPFLRAEKRMMVERHFAMLQEALATTTGDILLAKIEQIAEVWYNNG